MNDTSEYLPGAEEAPPETAELLPAVIQPPANPVAARDAGIAAYLASAYAKAGTLKLTPEETKALKADFADEAFVTGAAGKESLIYIDPRALRDRLDDSLGMGSWSLVPIRTWNEEYKVASGPAIRVYRECVLIVRGVFITQATGDMTYYPNNAATNYGDAYQGSESHALRRCLKNFGVGLQAYSKTFQAGWFERQRTKGRNEPPPPAPATPPAKPATKSAEKIATANTRAFVLEELQAGEDGANRVNLTNYLRAIGWLDADKEVEQWPYRFIPISKPEIEQIKVCLGTFALNAETPGFVPERPYPPHGVDPSTLKPNPVAPAKNGWSDFVIGFGKHKGKKLGALAVPEIEFYFHQFTPRTTVDVQQIDGTVIQQPVPPESVKVQTDLRAMLDIAGKELGFTQQPKQ